MKKLLLTLLVLLSLFTIVGCKKEKEEEPLEKISVIMPTGTPALALANYVKEAKDKDEADVSLVAGADLLKSAFINKDKDVIVAPVNLGAMMYNNYEAYVLYKTFVWGNLYLASKNELTSINDLNEKTLVVFGQNSTPDIVFKAIMQNYEGVNVTVEYVDDVATANTMLATGKAEYIVSAEPALTKIKAKLGLNVIDLQDEWKKISGSESYPQAAIFVLKDKLENKSVKNALNKMVESVNSAISNHSECAKNAVSIHESFATLTEEVLVASIPNCHFKVMEDEKEAVKFYLQKMIDLGFSKQVGGKVPSEGFFA